MTNLKNSLKKTEELETDWKENEMSLLSESYANNDLFYNPVLVFPV